MDTPVKNQHSPATPFSSSKFEDSPVFNFLSNLSPIGTVKTRHNDHTFNSLNFASPPSLFASPQISSYSETGFAVARHHFSDSSKPESLRSEGENNTSEVVPVAVQPSGLCSSAREVNNEPEPLTENLELVIELPSSLKHESGSPSSSFIPSDAIEKDRVLETTNTRAQAVQCVTDDSKERHSLPESEKYLRRICHVKQTDEASRCNWVEQISSDTDNLFNYDSLVTVEQSEGQDSIMVDPGTASFISNVLEDDLNKFENPESIDLVGSREHCVNGGSGIESEGIGDLKEIDEMPALLSSTLMDKLVVTESNDRVDDERQKGTQSICKPRSQLHRTIRRRCLDFERAGSHEKKSSCEYDGSSSVSTWSNSKAESVQNKFVDSKNESFCSSAKLPGVSLHLNNLATTTEEKVGKNDSLVLERKLSRPMSIRSCNSLIPYEISHDNHSPERSSLRELVLYDNEDQAVEDANQTSTCVGEESDHTSPQHKRQKSEHLVENLGCKRCNCKRSKCLKLYCECFAAGLYCVGSCSCLDCLNNPIHENTVLETRRQIESRNPLAFAPKVIRSTDAVAEFVDETSTTPASARHKRGCNCRKSSCLKKYCECFQESVGCSMSCRCTGCKNTFGRKDSDCFSGVEEIEFKESKLETVKENNAMDVETVGEPDIPKTPIGTGRHSFQRPITLTGRPFPRPQLNGKNPETSRVLRGQLKYESRLKVILEGENHEKMEKSSQETSSSVKLGSPNSERVSPHGHGESGSSLSCWKGGRKLILRSFPTFKF